MLLISKEGSECYGSFWEAKAETRPQVVLGSARLGVLLECGPPCLLPELPKRDDAPMSPRSEVAPL